MFFSGPTPWICFDLATNCAEKLEKKIPFAATTPGFSRLCQGMVVGNFGKNGESPCKLRAVPQSLFAKEFKLLLFHAERSCTEHFIQPRFSKCVSFS